MKADNISPDEQKDLEGFVSIYTYGLSLLEEYRSEKHIKIINVPEDFIMPEEPVRDPILDCEKEIEDELSSTYKDLGLFSNNLKRYISSTDELPNIFEKFFKIKEDYSINLLKYQCFSTLSRAYKIQEKSSDIPAKLNCCIALIDKYLELHPDLSKDYPKLSYEMGTEIIDFNTINQNFEKLLEKEKKNLEDYYTEILVK